MSNSFFSVQHFFNHWGKPCGKFVEKNSPIFKKEKTPEGANSSKTPANRGNSRQNRKKRGEKTDFQPSTAVSMTKGPLEHSENAGNPFLRRLEETR